MDALCGLPLVSGPNVLRSMADLDNAGVYRLSDDIAIVQTVDFFTPIVDDPYTFGQIAVANSLSDVYTMGARAVTALNIVCFPSGKLANSVLRETLRGGADKMVEAGVVLLGGHSVDDPEFKYGLAVTGTVHPGRLVTNGGARAGDKLIITKPLGTGVLSTALKRGALGPEAAGMVAKSMAALNKTASELMLDYRVHACTDITGFGFAGHASQMASNSGVALSVEFAAFPIFPDAKEFAASGFLPGGARRNRDYYGSMVKFRDGMAGLEQDLLFDPQTSGGLLISLDAADAGKLLGRLRQAGVEDASIVGEVVASPKGSIIVR